MTDELERMSKLHKEGALSEEEFAKAKSKLLQSDLTPPNSSPAEETSQRFMFAEILAAVLGVILFLIVLFGVILPRMHFHRHF